MRLERLEEIEAPDNLLALASPLAPAALVGNPSPAPADEGHMQTVSLYEEHAIAGETPNIIAFNQFLSELAVFRSAASADDASHLSVAQDAFAARLESESSVLSSFESLEPLNDLSANVLPTLKTPPGLSNQPIQPNAPSGANGNVGLGCGSSPGGVSTPAVSGGGASSGGGGAPMGGNLATLAMEGAFGTGTRGTAIAPNANSTPVSSNQTATALTQPQGNLAFAGPSMPTLPATSSASQAQAQSLLNKLSWMFEANAGQFDAQTQFLARGPAYDVALSATQAQFLFSSASSLSNPTNPTATTPANTASPPRLSRCNSSAPILTPRRPASTSS